MSEQHDWRTTALAAAALEAGVWVEGNSADGEFYPMHQPDVNRPPERAAGVFLADYWSTPMAALVAAARALGLDPHPAIHGLVDRLRAAAKLTTNVEQSMCGAADLLAQTPMYTRAAQQLRELADDAGRQRDAMRELLGEEAEPHA